MGPRISDKCVQNGVICHQDITRMQVLLPADGDREAEAPPSERHQFYQDFTWRRPLPTSRFSSTTR
ncbi:hypothetical protein TSMEX_006157, partial [Taenia solium]